MSDWFGQWSTYLPALLQGLQLSLIVAALSLLVGLPVGLLFAVLASSRRRLVSTCAIVIVELGRGAPLLVVLEFVFFGAPSFGLRLGPVAAAVAAFGWNTAAYTSEMFRGGLLAVPVGMREAAAALGLNGRDAFRYIVLPEGLRISLPALMGWAILTFQGTSLCFVIGLPEMLSRAYEIASVNFEYLNVLVLVGVLYAVFAIPASWLTRYTERRLGAGTAW